MSIYYPSPENQGKTKKKFQSFANIIVAKFHNIFKSYSGHSHNRLCRKAAMIRTHKQHIECTQSLLKSTVPLRGLDLLPGRNKTWDAHGTSEPYMKTLFWKKKNQKKKF